MVDHPELAREEVVELESKLFRDVGVEAVLEGEGDAHAVGGGEEGREGGGVSVWKKGGKLKCKLLRDVGVQAVLEKEGDAHTEGGEEGGKERCGRYECVSAPAIKG